MVLTGYPTYCTTPTRSGKREGRHRVESDEGPLRLDVELLGLSREYLPYLEVNLFATRLTYQLPHFYSWRPDPLAEVTVAFLQDWRRVNGYANPPWNLVGRVLSKVESQGAELILIAPIWPSQPWYPRLLSLLVSQPLRIDPWCAVTEKGDLPELTPSLAMWPTSGNTTQARDFQRKLQSSCHPGDPRRPSPMTHSLRSGSAGVLNGSMIQF